MLTAFFIYNGALCSGAVFFAWMYEKDSDSGTAGV